MTPPMPLDPNSRRRALRTLASGLAGAGVLPALGAVPDRRAAGAAGRPAWPPPPAARDDEEAFWAFVRAQYPLTRDRVYFNTGGLGPAPYPVLDAQARTAADLQHVSETGHDRLEAARAPVAAFFGCAPDELAFMRNATEANSTVASGLKALRRGDEVLFESHAHPGGSIPWVSRAKQEGIRIRIFEPDAPTPDALLERIERAITPRTRVIQVSHVTAPTGIRMPVERIAALAKARNIWFHIDGAQSAGMFPVDVHALGCDSYGASCHKWMGAPHGTGVLYVRAGRFDDIAPTEVGAYSDAGLDLPDRLDYAPSARRFEPGTRDAASVVGIAAAAAFLTEIGLARIQARGHGLARRAAAGLAAIGGVEVVSPSHAALATSITTFRAARVPFAQLTASLLSTHKLRCRQVAEQGLNAVRVSTHLFTSEADVDRLIAAVAQTVREA